MIAVEETREKIFNSISPFGSPKNRGWKYRKLYGFFILATLSFIFSNVIWAASQSARQLISLDGEWNIYFDAEDTATPDSISIQSESTKIKVPACWEEINPGYDGAAWYWRDFDVPKEWKHKIVRIEFGAANYFAQVWINKKNVGSHEGGYTPFVFDITDALEFGGSNRLVVKVIDPPFNKRVGGFTLGSGWKQREVPSWKEGRYDLNFGGLWQSVKLLVTSDIYIKDVFVMPNIEEGIIAVEATIMNKVESSAAALSQISCKLSVSPKKQPGKIKSRAGSLPVKGSMLKNVSLQPGKNVVNFTVKISSPQLWTVEHPHLYVLKITLDGENGAMDETDTTFGMRSFTVKNGDFYLNNQKIVLKGVMDQGVYPLTIAYPPDEEYARREITLIKEAGFNLLRLHVKTSPPVLMHFADELGLLLYEEPSIAWMKSTQCLRERCMREVREMVKRDRNHPSIVMWGMINEKGSDAGSLRGELCLHARKFDPTRIIIDDSGGYSSEVRGNARMYLPYQTVGIVYSDIHQYIKAPVDAQLFNNYKSLGNVERVTFLSEFGFGSVPDFPEVLRKYRDFSELFFRFNPSNPRNTWKVGRMEGRGQEDKDRDTRSYAPTFLNSEFRIPNSEFRRGANENLQDYAQYQKFMSDIKAVYKKRNLDEVFGTLSNFCRSAQIVQAEGNARMIEALRINPALDGYCLTQIIDAGWEFSEGILDTWLTPKKAHRAISEVNKPTRIVLIWSPLNIYSGEEFTLDVTLVNERGFTGLHILQVDILSPSGEIKYTKKLDVTLTSDGIQSLGKLTPRVVGSSGVYTMRARLMSNARSHPENRGEEKIAESEYELYCADKKDLDLPSTPISIFASENLIQSLRKNWENGNFVDFSVDDTSPIILVAYTRNFNAIPQQQMSRIVQVVKAGGAALFLNPPNHDGRILPFRIRRENTAGWIAGAFHYIRKHPIFDGLPDEPVIAQIYANVCPTESFGLPDKGKEIAGAVAVQHTYGGGYRTGSDIIEIPCGKGKILLSSFKLVDYLGKDSLADKIFVNMMKYLAN